MRLYMKEHLPLYIFISVLFVMGVIFGALMVNALSIDQKQEMTDFLGSFFHTIDQGADLDGKESFLQVFGLHMKWMVLIWILGLTIIGLPLILILDFLKGVFVGFTVGYLVAQLSWKGMLFALVSVAPQNLIIIPVLIISSVTAISFSIYIVKNRFIQRKGTVSQPFMAYSMVTLSLMCLMFGISLFEAFVSSVIMKWVTPMLLAL
ncbi:MAG TPA: stage II sporulation protein M [Bacilli bacterium]